MKIVMGKIIRTFGSGIIFFILLFSGCPSFEPAPEITEIRIFTGGINIEINSITIEQGETVTLFALTNNGSENISIVWEIDNQNAAITGSGHGSSCSIRGMAEGTAALSILAWRSPGDTPVTKVYP